jgi:hypothetical protein
MADRSVHLVFAVGRAAILACGLPSNTDTAPKQCPNNPAAGK